MSRMLFSCRHQSALGLGSASVRLFSDHALVLAFPGGCTDQCPHFRRGLLDLCCKTVADIIKGMTPQEIRDYFHIENDFTPEEEDEVRRENQCAVHSAMSPSTLIPSASNTFTHLRELAVTSQDLGWHAGGRSNSCNSQGWFQQVALQLQRLVGCCCGGTGFDFKQLSTVA